MTDDLSRRSAPGAKADRDRILEDALKHELRGASALTGEACLDAETLAAWEDDGLDAKAMEAVELHVSSCARCQAMAAVSLRGTQAPSTHLGTQAPRHQGTLVWWKWLTPLAAGAAAVTLWIVLPEQREVALAPPQPPVASTEAVKPQAPAAEPSASTPPPPAPAANAQPLRDASPREARSSAAKEAPQERARADAPAPANKQELQRAEAVPGALAETITVQSPPPAAPLPPPAPAAPPAVARGATSDMAGVTAQRRATQFAFGPVEITSPVPAQRWRITQAGIERTVDAGGAWLLVRATAGEIIAAGASPAPNVCWMIGNEGLVLLTTNGSVFTRVDIPGGGNLRSITAVDGRSAAVVNAAGRTFRTDDGGLTWR